MAIYKGGQSQFGLHESANSTSERLDDPYVYGKLAAHHPDEFKVSTLEKMNDNGVPTPISGAGLELGRRQKGKK